MNSSLSGVAASRGNRSACPTLTGLMSSVGHTGLPAATRSPALLAAVDQHAAAVRDSLGGDRQPLNADLLAGYARGVRDAAHENGWRAPHSPIQWPAADWVLIRLLAVCVLVGQLPADARP